MPPRIDITDSFVWQEDLPRPQWDVLNTFVEYEFDADEQADAWTEIARQWLGRLGEALNSDYEVHESKHCLLLCARPDSDANVLLRTLETSRQALLSILQGVADFRTPGKQVAIVLTNANQYYSYVCVNDAEGHHGASGSMQIRDGYPHVVAYGRHLAVLQNTLAHEMTHASLAYLSLPQWLEEGLAQMFEEDIGGRQPLLLTSEAARRHKRYWNKHGLESFWRGEGFSRPGKVQELSYQLAEILLRLLASEHRPRWFGLNREPQRRLLAFIRDADACDCGEAAAREHLRVQPGRSGREIPRSRRLDAFSLSRSARCFSERRPGVYWDVSHELFNIPTSALLLPTNVENKRRWLHGTQAISIGRHFSQQARRRQDAVVSAAQGSGAQENRPVRGSRTSGRGSVWKSL